MHFAYRLLLLIFRAKRIAATLLKRTSPVCELSASKYNQQQLYPSTFNIFYIQHQVYIYKNSKTANNMATLLKMMTNLSAPVIRSNGRRQLCLSHWNRRTFEPDYLYSAVPPIPTYPPINIQVGE